MYILEIEKFDGHSTLRSKLDSWNSGPGNPPNGPGRSGATNNRITDVYVMRPVDKHSHVFFSRARDGTRFEKVAITTRFPSGKGSFTVTMTDVFVSAYQVVDGPGHTPVETMTFSFGKIEFSYGAPTP